MTSQELAIDIVEFAQSMSFNKPLKTEFYIHLAGLMATDIESYGWEHVKHITRKEWQCAKFLVFSSEFNFEGWEE